MADQATPTTAPTSAPPTPPPAAAAAPAPQARTSGQATRPNWLPAEHWDGETGAIKEDFGAHFGELAAFRQNEMARRDALPKSADGYKIEFQLPETVKVPDGMRVTPDETHPLAGPVRAIAQKHGLSQAAFSDLVAAHAEFEIAQHGAEQARVAAEKIKLGANADSRLSAVAAWLSGRERSGRLTSTEAAALAGVATDAAAVTAIEKLMRELSGSIATNDPPAAPPKPEPKSLAARLYGATTPKQR